MSLAFGEPPDLGVKKFASAADGTINDAPRVMATAMRTRRRSFAAGSTGRKAGAFYPRSPRSVGGPELWFRPYTRGPLRVSRGIRATAWALVAAGVAAPVVRRRWRLPAAAVLV